MLQRWWIYQRERFPLHAHTPIIAVFSSAMLLCSAQLRGATQMPTLAVLLASFLITLLFFLQLRIADEYKDDADDVQYRPYRPVPRGLVTLHELGAVAIAGAVLQFLLTLWLVPLVLPLLLVVWGYMALMRVEFFVHDWLKAHPLLYMVSHMLILPLIALYLSAWEWLQAGATLPPGLAWLLVLSFCNGLVFEIGRKIRAPQAEEPGVETYSVLWGRQRAVAAWLVAVLGTAGSVGILAWYLGVPIIGIVIPGVVVVLALAVAVGFLHTPANSRARLIEGLSGLGLVVIYTSIGIVPVLL